MTPAQTIGWTVVAIMGPFWLCWLIGSVLRTVFRAWQEEIKEKKNG